MDNPAHPASRDWTRPFRLIYRAFRRAISAVTGPIARAIDAVDRELRRRIRQLDRRIGGYWWLLLTGGLVLALPASTGLSALGKQLASMHLPGHVGYGLQKAFGRPPLGNAAAEWRLFWDTQSGAALPGRSPLSLAVTSIVLDLALVAGYLVTFSVILVRNQRRVRRMNLKPILRWALLAIVVAAVADVVEDVLILWLLPVFWNHHHPSAALTLLLTVATNVKGALFALTLLALLLTAVARYRDRTAETGRAYRLLRAHLLVALLAVILLSAPIQLADLVLRLDAMQSLVVIALAVVLSLATWSSGRLLVALHERRAPPPPLRHPPQALYLLIFGPLVAVALVNRLTHNDAIAPLIPVGFAVVLFLLGLPLRGATSRPEPASVGVMGLVLPLTLAGVVVMATALAAIRAGVTPFVQGQTAVGALVVSLTLIVLSVGLVVGFYFVETRLVPHPAVRFRKRKPESVSPATQGQRASQVKLFGWLAAGTTLLVIAANVWILANPISIPQRVGGVAIALLFLVALTLTLGLLILLADWWTARFGVPAALQAFDLKRLPIISLIALWAVVAAFVDDGAHWNVQVSSNTISFGGLATTVHPYSGIHLDEAFTRWLDHAKARVPSESAAMRAPIPMVIVATSGGGIRSAYWTALAMDCLFSGRRAPPGSATDPNPCGPTADGRTVSPQDVFLASGISGGSVGLVEWDASRDVETNDRWVADHLGRDFVSPSLARGLLVELPRSLLHFKAAGRDDVLQRAWERPWGSRTNPLTYGFLRTQTRREAAGGPLLLLNGSSVFDGCDLNVSLLDVGSTVDQAVGNAPPGLSVGDCASALRYLKPPGQEPAGPLPLTADLTDYLGCPSAMDVPRSSAGLLSARFPYVSGAGRLQACGLETSVRYVVDGGYIDTSGAESALAVWFGIQPLIQQVNRTDPSACVVPYFVQLDNSYLSQASPRDRTKPPNQTLAPLQALWNTTGLQSRASRARGYAADLFTQPFALDGTVAGGAGLTGRYELIAPNSHPGLEAPLGWTLAPGSQRDLEQQLYEVNRTQIETVRRWLEHPPSCPPPAQP